MRNASQILCKSLQAWPLLTAACLAACAASPPLFVGDPDTDEVALELHAVWRGHFDAIRTGNVDGAIAMYAEGAIYAVPGMPVVRGREELERMESQGIAAGKLLGATHTTEALRVTGNTAYELGTVRGRVQPNGEAAARVTFHYAATWQVDDDGHWRILTITGQVPGSR